MRYQCDVCGAHGFRAGTCTVCDLGSRELIEEIVPRLRRPAPTHTHGLELVLRELAATHRAA